MILKPLREQEVAGSKPAAPIKGLRRVSAPSDPQIAQHVGKAVQGPGDSRVIRLELQRHLRHSARERARALQDLVDLSHRLSESFTELWINGLGRFERRLKLVERFPKALSLVGE